MTDKRSIKMTLISPYPDITNYGLRVLSALLREKGWPTQMIFMPDFAGDGESVHGTMTSERYSPEIIEQTLELVKDSQLVGITLMTHYFDSGIQITQAIKERYPDIKVIWGGFHPSVRPDECIKYADFVAIGDAEDLLLEVLEKMESGDNNYEEIDSLVWRKDENTVVRNQPGALEQELDNYPAPDFSRDDHWILFEGDMQAVTKDLINRYLTNGTVSRMFARTGYQTMTGRGCPHACTYCGNSFYRDLYKRQRFVRYRSVEDVMQELEAVKREYPFINFIWFSDDSFFGRPLPDMLKFCSEYKDRVNEPFYLLGSPGTITDEKYGAAVDAGMICIQMGVEHGSKRIQKIFKRSTMGNEKILRSAEIMAKYADRTAPPQFDLVYDLAYETLDDKLDTLRLIAELPKPYRLQIFSVIYYPGTSLHTLAVEDGLVYDERDEIYDRMYSERHDSYTNTLLFFCRTGKFPHGLLKVLTNKSVAEFMTSDYMAPAGVATKKALDVFRAVLRNPAIDRARALGDISSARLEGMTGANAGAAAPTSAK